MRNRNNLQRMIDHALAATALTRSFRGALRREPGIQLRALGRFWIPGSPLAPAKARYPHLRAALAPRD